MGTNNDNEIDCGWEMGECPSRRLCDCPACVAYCAERYGEDADPPVAPQEWYIDRE